MENLGGVVLHLWQQFLANDALSFLGIQTPELVLEFEDPTTPKGHWDLRAIQGDSLYVVGG